MRDFRRLPLWMGALVCLGFTGSHVAWADPARADWVEDPYAAHVTKGSTARLGTVVGVVYGDRVDVTAVGLAAAVGQRWGRLALESEYTYLGFQERGPSSLRLGDGHRLGVMGRFDVIRAGSRYVGPNSMLAVYVEGGAAVAWNRWSRPSYDEASRVVPDDTKRVEGQVGFGIEIEHRLQEPIGFPRRIGWFLGWRLALAPHEAGLASICRGESCRPAPMMPEERYTDRSMLFQSSMAVTW
ncbi:MAG: hypothetical protein JWP01_1536 [Myxococcales bacterium]|nr:hypothetical protein [Myxococcales bacterium]